MRLAQEKEDLTAENGRLLRELDQYDQYHGELQKENVELKSIVIKESAHRAALAT